MKFRKRPVEIEAEQATVEGSLPCGLIYWPGAWIVTHPDGRAEIVPDKVFQATYEPAELRLVWPLEKTRRITQPFGVNPQNYKGWGLPGHEGIDFAARVGEKVLACIGGIVSRVDIYRGDWKAQPYGTHVRVKTVHGDVTYTLVYAHLSAALVKVGQVVEGGHLLGLAGSTGNSSGPHLHITMKRDGASQRGETHFPSDILDPTPFLEKP